MFEGVLASGEAGIWARIAAFDHGTIGYPEETYFTFSYVPCGMKRPRWRSISAYDE